MLCGIFFVKNVDKHKKLWYHIGSNTVNWCYMPCKMGYDGKLIKKCLKILDADAIFIHIWNESIFTFIYMFRMINKQHQLY